MSKAIIASLAILSLGWWFSTYCVILGWVVYGTSFVLKEGAKGGAFDK